MSTKSKRAANRMGSITQRGDGRWEGKVSFKKPDNTPGRKTVYGTHRPNVEKKCCPFYQIYSKAAR